MQILRTTLVRTDIQKKSNFLRVLTSLASYDSLVLLAWLRTTMIHTYDTS